MISRIGSFFSRKVLGYVSNNPTLSNFLKYNATDFLVTEDGFFIELE